MKPALIAAMLALAFTLHAQQKDTAQTPQHEHAAMMQRGDQGMGFSQEKTTHHFRLLPDGGAIEVSANDPKDTASRDQIRAHLAHIAQMFAAGNFSVPMFVHDTTPPGAATMRKLRGHIRYRYRETRDGGRVDIRTRDPQALEAVHQFLRFQIAEHHTGDSTQVAR
jgi:hypothetical protein